jgi:methylglyoxal synthase
MTRIRLALVAHDARKDEMVAWARRHLADLSRCDLTGTGTTGSRVAEATGLQVERLKSGPWGGDAQLGAMIAEGRLDALIFFTDPMSALPHDVDVKSLIRLAVLYDVPCAMSPSAADFVLAGVLSTSD